MREIKFRAWNEDENKMIDWYDEFFSDMSPVTRWSSYFSFIEMPLMQYTGLKDSTKWEDLTEKEREEWVLKGNMPSEWKGKEIYESDILKITNNFELRKGIEIDKVVWWESGATYCCSDWTLFELIQNHADNEQEYEVIGNIYENPEPLNN